MYPDFLQGVGSYLHGLLPGVLQAFQRTVVQDAVDIEQEDECIQFLLADLVANLL